MDKPRSGECQDKHRDQAQQGPAICRESYEIHKFRLSIQFRGAINPSDWVVS